VEAPRPGARFAEAYDPYATETKARAVAAGIPEDDAFQLAGIELACDAADAWAVLPAWLPGAARVTGAWVPLARALDRLELATRGSAMRKVKP
jgi:hypothetical protein